MIAITTCTVLLAWSTVWEVVDAQWVTIAAKLAFRFGF
jgi:hypothetical protein